MRAAAPLLEGLRQTPSEDPAAIGAMALPAGAAMAALPVDSDPGLAQLEAGYRRWCELLAERDRLDTLATGLGDRADALVEPRIEAHPKPHPDIVAYVPPGYLPIWGPGDTWQETPEDRIEAAQQYIDQVTDWRRRRNALLDQVPEYQESRECRAACEQLDGDANALRKEVLAIPTRGLLIKLAVAVEAKSLDAIEPEAEDFWSWAGEDLLPHLAADLRAMAGASAA